MPENLDGNLKPYVLDFTGANIGNIYMSINNTIQSIEKMANIGGVRATESRVLSGVALETEFQLLNAKLSSFANNLELAEEQMWDLFARYQNTTYNGNVTYPGSFNIKDTSTDIGNLRVAKEVATDPALLAEINNQLAELLEIEDFTSVMQSVEISD
jgi:hypothetical protein